MGPHNRSHTHNSATHKPGQMRQPLKAPKRLLQERELCSSLVSLVVLVVRTVYVQTFNEHARRWFSVSSRNIPLGAIPSWWMDGPHFDGGCVSRLAGAGRESAVPARARKRCN